MLFRSDRKSTRLNSSHTIISYAVFCLKKKNKSISRSPQPFMIPPTNGHLPTGRRHRVCARRPSLVGESVSVRYCCALFFFFLKKRPPPNSSPFPLPTLFPI